MVRICSVRIVVFGAVLALAGSALAQGWQDDEFDARRLTATENRIVQAALALSGDYAGLLDGEWGRRSQAALDAYVQRKARDPKPKFRHLVPLLDAFEAERRAKGWTTSFLGDDGISFAYPAGWVLFDEAGSRKHHNVRYTSPNGDFAFMFEISGVAAAASIHRHFRGATGLLESPYHVDGQDRTVTAVNYPDGMRAYVLHPG